MTKIIRSISEHKVPEEKNPSISPKMNRANSYRTKNSRLSKTKNPNFYLSNKKTLKLSPKQEQISIFMTMLLPKKVSSLLPQSHRFLRERTALEVLWASKKDQNKKRLPLQSKNNLSSPTNLVSSRRSPRRWVWWRGQWWSTMRSLRMDHTAKTVTEIVMTSTQNNLEIRIVRSNPEDHSRSSQRSKSARKIWFIPSMPTCLLEDRVPTAVHTKRKSRESKDREWLKMKAELLSKGSS